MGRRVNQLQRKLFPQLGAVAPISSTPDLGKLLVLAPCSAGKRFSAQVTGASLPRGEQSLVAATWLAALQAPGPLTPAHRLYKGRAFQVARTAADGLGADFGVISAGLGFVGGDRPIPAYDLTLRGASPNAITRRVVGPFDAAAWWRDIQAGPFADNFQAALDEADLVLIAASAAYLQLITQDLEAFVVRRPGALRLFGLSLHRVAPAGLQAAIMPYDARLERLGRPGTRTDFSARALADFAAEVARYGGDAGDQAERVARRLAAAPEADPARPQKRADDPTLKAEIRSLLPRSPRVSDVLRSLRHEAGWSCEQNRFRRLYAEVRSEMAG